jgi:acetyl-CoA/propionyl-CoA carboxylase carboxyl transferase subunit
MGPDGAVKIIHREKLQQSSNPDALRESLTKDYRENTASPLLAAAEGYLDTLITPAESRPQLVRALGMLLDKRQTTPDRKHANIPL